MDALAPTVHSFDLDDSSSAEGWFLPPRPHSNPASLSIHASAAASLAAVASALGCNLPWLVVGLGNPRCKFEGTCHNNQRAFRFKLFNTKHFLERVLVSVEPWSVYFSFELERVVPGWFQGGFCYRMPICGRLKCLLLGVWGLRAALASTVVGY